MMSHQPSAQELHAVPEIAGFRGPVPDVRLALEKLAAIEEEHGVSVQLLDAGMVYGEEHLRAAFASAARAMARGRARGSTLGPEVMRYAAGHRQVGSAITAMGVGRGGGEDERVAAMAWSAAAARAIAAGEGVERADCGPALSALAEALGWKRDDGVLGGDADVLAALGIDASAAGDDGGGGERGGQGGMQGDGLGLVLEMVAMADLRK
jgi:tRNA threonylcarbamoyladenosine modification (KEOPS) complex Cgi121 subunit